jgi:hypothetical protein
MVGICIALYRIDLCSEADALRNGNCRLDIVVPRKSSPAESDSSPEFSGFMSPKRLPIPICGSMSKACQKVTKRRENSPSTIPASPQCHSQGGTGLWISMIRVIAVVICRPPDSETLQSP